MAKRRLSMRKLRQILKLKLVREYPHRRIAESVGVSPGSVGSVISRAKAKGLRKWESVEPLAESELEQLLYGAGWIMLPATMSS